MKMLIRPVLIVICFLILDSCKKPGIKQVKSDAESYKEYITAYSSGLHQRNEPVRIEFAKPVVDPGQVDKPVDAGFYKIDPALSGRCIWKNVQLLEFYPDKKELDGNKEYQLVLDLKIVFPQIAENLRYAAFNFFYQPVEIIVKWGFPRPLMQKDAGMYLQGSLRINDEIEAGQLAEMFTVKSKSVDKHTVQVQVSASDPYLYELSVAPIQRNDQQTSLTIEWSHNDNRGSSKQGSRSFNIPSKNEFIVSGIDDSRIANHDLTIYFSNVLDEKQDILGLVHLKNDTTVLQCVKDGDLIHVHLPDHWQKKSGTLQISRKILSREGLQQINDYEYVFDVVQNPPQVRFANRGKILPYNRDIILPFEAINLNTVEVEVFKTFANNVLYNMHLGFDDDYGSYNLVRLGRVVKQQVINLAELSPESNVREWKRYGLNLSELIATEPGANYQVRISFKPEYTDFPCPLGKPVLPENFYEEESGDPDITSFWRSYAYYDYSDYESNDTKDPCNLSYYYRDHFAQTSFFASNLAMMAKSSEDGHQTLVAVYDVLDGSPVKNAEVILYDHQLQILTKSKTDGNGIAIQETNRMPAYVQSIHGKHYSYLKISDNKSLSQSEFDISGVKVKQGLKATLYTERGVWRPGDTVYMNAIVTQQPGKIPEQFPVELTLKNPQRQVIYKSNKSDHLRGLYAFTIPTRETDLTGMYSAQLQVGLSVFDKNILIETVKPNRFKVEWPEIQEIKMENLTEGIPLKAKWLHGAAADSAHAQVTLAYKLIPPDFPKYNDYTFVDPEVQQYQGEQELWNESLDKNGEGMVFLPDFSGSIHSGKLRSTFITKITGSDGDISTDYYESTVSPFSEFVGVKLPDNPYGRQIAMGVDQDIQIIVLNNQGKPVANRQVAVEVFQVSYEWWYELRNSYQGDYQRRSINKRVIAEKVKTDPNGKAIIKINLKEYDRYYLKVTNTENQYSTGDYFYTGWSYDQASREFVNILSFKTDKEIYTAGEKAYIDLPGSTNGIYLINILKGDKILKHESLNARKEKTRFEFALTAEMAPNIYIDVSFIQGRDNKKNDLPLRMYGVIPVYVVDEKKKLYPLITMNSVVRPDEKFTIEIAEKNSREMAYQLFIVDEGLLTLTRFKIPDPYGDLMAKEALALFTWDNFNDVIGSMNGEMEKIFSIGGDRAVDGSQESKNKRFNPVVLKTGPRLLKKGEKQKHEFEIQNYIGAVRVMVIANDYNAFGSVDKTVSVKNELMAQVTAPRVFSFVDEVDIPVTVFVSDAGIKDVRIQFQTTGNVKLMDNATKTLRFDHAGDQTVFYKLKGSGTMGNAELVVNATSGSFVSKNKVSFYVDNPNAVTHEVKQFWVEPGASLNEMIPPYGMEGTRKVKLEVSGFQGFSIEKLIDELVRYPHGCLEQITSSAFPQIYLAGLSDLSMKDKEEVNQNINAAIEKLRRFQRSNGSFSYWPGDDGYSDWSDSYAGHFLVEARNAGYRVPEDLLTSWYKAQQSHANVFRVSSKQEHYRPYLMQAYRLFTLALYGKPEWTAMNQLLQEKRIDFMSKVLLSGAYALSGKGEIAHRAFSGDVENVNPYREYSYSFGSATRDEALIAQVLVLLERRNEASNLMNKLIRRTSGMYYSTQEMAMILIAMGKLYGSKTDHKLKFSYAWNKEAKDMETNKPVFSENLSAEKKQSFKFTNNAGVPLAVSIIQEGKEISMSNVNISKGLNLKVDLGIPQNANYRSGDEINAIISVTNLGTAGRIDNLALTSIFPSGLEIQNRRIGGIGTANGNTDYEDYRDDRIIYYFGLKAGETRTFRIPVNASYPGLYPAPLFVCEAMYDPSVVAKYRSGNIRILSRK